MFCGRLGNSVLAGYGMASATINITTAATGGGLGLAADTLISQTFGGKNLRRVGIILQRSVLILLLFCLPCWALLINTQPLLLLLGQDPEVARIAQLYVVCYLPAVPAMFLHQLQVAYLQNQGVILPQMYAAIAANIANVVTNYILLNWLDLGLYGSAAANTVSQVYICVFLYLYIRWKKLHVETWGGWSCDSLQEWDGYMKLAIPSTMMLCFEWWIYEVGGFLAAALAVLQGLVLASTKTVIGFLFTSDGHIVALVSKLLNVYCVLQFFDGLVAVERAGKRKISSVSAPDTLTARHRENGDEYMNMNTNGRDEEPGVEEKPPALLSTAQLVLRRGLTTIAALFILAVGIVVHLTVPLPEVSNAVRANTTLDSNFTTPSSFYIPSTSISS
ncbi:multidrug and toxin extrusion 1-like protein [Labeo rohita]|uniref:Multidrug and toxin extrusion 1-like protein n=1 Tax=Labeo rohita TaxID=84645 RepID=A0A498LLN9_LABRO|nr:multidrug and toxin extrusion 1-like protein [Labeo rohita]